MPRHGSIVPAFGWGFVRRRAGYLVAWDLNTQEESAEEGHEGHGWLRVDEESVLKEERNKRLICQSACVPRL